MTGQKETHIMATKKTEVQVRRVHIGNAAVDSGMLMVVDPCYVLKDEHPGTLPPNISLNTDYNKAIELSHSSSSFRLVGPDEKQDKKDVLLNDPKYPKPIRVRSTRFDDAKPLTNEQHEQIAYGAVCSTGRGDGLFPVYAVYVGDALVSMEVRFDLE
jgi:hypothetical protein